MLSRRRSFDLPLLVFGLTAFWGTTTSSDVTAAGHRFLWIAGGLLLYALVSRLPGADRAREQTPALDVVVCLITGALAAWFLLTNDWARAVDKVPWLDGWQRLLGPRPWIPDWPAVHPNAAGGVLACLLPLHVAAVWPTGAGSWRQPWRLLGWLLLAAVAFAVLMSRLRGGWLALAAGAIAALWWRACARWLGDTLRGRLFALATALAAIALGTAAVVVVDGSLPRPDRWQLWINSWYLAWDYPFTGLGLAGFPMAYSSYALLVHVPHTMHAHNIFLDTWLEQGAVGLVAMIWVAWMGLSQPLHGLAPRWALAARVSWAATLVLGFVDDVHFGYDGVGAWLLFLPLAVQARGGRGAVAAEPTTPAQVRPGPWVVAPLVVGLTLTLVPGVRAAMTANRAALAQTRQELSLYRWPAWPVQDAIRRSPVANLDGVVSQYRQALAEATNASANLRLGQIEISLGEYESARTHLAAAYAGAPARPAVRQLLGEALAVTGDVEGAAQLWSTLALDVDQIEIREAWYRLIDEPERADLVREAAARASAR